MIRGAARAAEEEDELGEAIVLEILQEGRGKREERGEREEWNQHIGWHRKEDVGLRPKRQPSTKDHSGNQNQKRTNGMVKDAVVKKNNDHIIEKAMKHDLGKEIHRERNRPLRKRKHNHATDLQENSVLDRHGDENPEVGAWGVLQSAILVILLVGVAVWWNKGSVWRILGRRGIRRRDSTKGRTL